jgi:hypothetical protein
MILAALIAVPVIATGSPPVKNDQLAEVTKNLDMDYAKEIIEYLSSLGDSTQGLGFRGAGGPADIQSAKWIADEMKELGLLNSEGEIGADLEIVPVDSWEFKEAWLYVPNLNRTITAASFGGFPETGDEMTRQMIWLNDGAKSDYDAYEEMYGSDYFDDKIGLIDWIGYEVWTDSVAIEAMLHGIDGIVLTTIDCNVGQGPGALSCHDGLALSPEQYPDMVFPPLISITKDDGIMLRDMLLAGETIEPTMYSDINIVRMNYEHPELGGHGYNVVGILPGRYYDTLYDEYLIFGPHHDAWFYGAMDCDAAVATTLVIAKAIMEAIGPYELDRTIIFTSHTAEEYGVLNTYYDWLWGAYYQVTVQHPEWIGKSIAYFCAECIGMAGVPLKMQAPPELYSFIMKTLGKNRENLPYGASVDPRGHCWADQWPFTAAGIPGIEFETTDEEWDAMIYHTQLDAPAIIDYGYMNQLMIIASDMTLQLTSFKAMPYNFMTYASQLDSTLYDQDNFDVADLYPIYDEYGLDPATNLEPTLHQTDVFSEKAADLQYALSRVKGGYSHDINTRLMKIAGGLDQNFTAIGVWEQDWFPYQQPINDVYHLYEGIEILTEGPVTDDMISDAVWELNWVGIIWYYDYMSYENYMDQRDRLSGERQISWGQQTHLQPIIEIWEEYDALVGLQYDEEVTWDDIAWIVECLKVHLMEALGQLETAFGWMWESLEDANGQIDCLIGSL